MCCDVVQYPSMAQLWDHLCIATFQVYQVSEPQFIGAFSGHGCFFNLYIMIFIRTFCKCSLLWFALICPNDPLFLPFPLPLVLFLPTNSSVFLSYIYNYVCMYVCSTYQRKHVIYVFFLFTLSCSFFPIILDPSFP